MVKQNQARVYAELGRLVEAGLLYYPRKLLKELERLTDAIAARAGGDPPYEWARAHAIKATRHGELFAVVKVVLAVPGVEELLDPEKTGAEEADPHVLALAHHLNGQGDFARVLTEDRKNKPYKIALAAACGLVGIPVVPMRAFLASRGIWRPPA